MVSRAECKDRVVSESGDTLVTVDVLETDDIKDALVTVDVLETDDIPGSN
ncbi:hypothetical protein FACS189472_17280 [Alphaproteobacteria bacterium]|nr:hypothetical protein FACS189472_17280 [Alphaproteobacteria bacterium]